MTAAAVIAAYFASFFLFKHSKPVMWVLVAAGLVVFVPLAVAIGLWVVEMY